MAQPLPVYRGEGQYVFVCYAHDDFDVVYPEIRWLQDQGVNVWYDEGITAGQVWRKEIGDALAGATHILFYISKNSLTSEHCDREMNLALDENKDILPIYLEDIELTSDLKVGFSRIQALYWTRAGTYRQNLLTAVGPVGASSAPAVAVARPRRRWALYTGLVVSAAVAVVVTVLLLRDGGTSPEPTESLLADTERSASPDEDAKATPTGDAKPSIAVLPFENLSSLEENVYFAAGFHDYTISTLSKIKSLRVISRTSVMPYVDTGKSMKAIGEELNVHYVLEGSVQRAGAMVRINVQLIDAVRDEHLWAETYDQEFSASNVFGIQSDVATRIATSLEAHLSPQGEAKLATPLTENTEALKHYLLGRQLSARNCESVTEAIEHYQQAVTLDPEFASAFAALALSYRDQIETCGLLTSQVRPNMRAAIDRALELDPDSGEAHAAEAVFLYSVALDRFLVTSREVTRVEAAFQRAIELNPNYAPAYMWYGNFLRRPGRFEDALVQFRIVLELDPRSLSAHTQINQVLQGLGRFEGALAQLDVAVALAPTFSPTYVEKGSLYAFAFGEWDRAFTQYRKALDLDPKSLHAFRRLASLYLRLGDYVEAEKWFTRYQQNAGGTLQTYFDRQPALLCARS